MKKQYSYEMVYNDNYEVFTYIDGVVEDSEIVSVWELSGYIDRLEDEGYEFCYSDAEFARVKSELSRLTALMEEIQKNRLYHEVVPSKNVTFKQDGMTYSIKLNPDEDDDILALWKCKSDSGACSNGYVFVDTTSNKKVCELSPQNIDKYIKVEYDDGIEAPVLIKRFIVDVLKEHINYDSLNNTI